MLKVLGRDTHTYAHTKPQTPVIKTRNSLCTNSTNTFILHPHVGERGKKVKTQELS